MLIIPIRTETSVRHAPSVNLVLIAANVAVFLALDVLMPAERSQAIKAQYFVLHLREPALYQYLTYQFAHADLLHLLGNMVFLWVFGNSVNGKLGDWLYPLFYLLGGAFAGWVFTVRGEGGALLGASGSIAAVTTAYLVLFPRSRVTILYFLFVIFGTAEVPAMLIIGLKIILWDNIVSPRLGTGGQEIAYAAHLAGYFYGFVVAFVLLLVRVTPRDQFDLLALFKRWNQRREFAAAMRDPEAQARAQFGRVARVAPSSPVERRQWEQRSDEQMTLRSNVAASLQQGDIEEAMRQYERLTALDDKQCLPAAQQLEIGRQYYASARFPQAASAFERYLLNYRSGPEADEVRLLLGIIAARELQQYETAEKHLRDALKGLTSSKRREQAQYWLDDVLSHLGKRGMA